MRKHHSILDTVRALPRNPVTVIGTILFLCCTLGVLLPVYLLFGEIIALIVVSAIAAIALCILKPTWWIYGVLLSTYFFYGKSSTEETSLPLLLAMAYHASLFVWIFNHVVLKKQRFIKHWTDLLYLLFLVFLALNGSLSALNDVDFLNWIKGWQLFLIVVYYIPIREIFTEKKQQNILLAICAVVLTIQGISNIYLYKAALSNFKFASQLMYVGIRQGAAVFAVACLTTITGVLFTRNTYLRLILLCFHIFCFGVLLVSLSRAAWVGYAAGMLLIGLVMRGQYRKNFIVGTLTLSCTMLLVGYVFFGRYFDVATKVVNQRFSSSAKFATDPSYLSRTYENNVLIEGITDYPLGGEGLQNSHNRYDAINRYTVINTYAHNNYLGSAQKMGIPLAALYFGILLGLFIRNWLITMRTSDPRSLFFAISSLSGLSSMFVFNFVGSIFDQREGVFLVAVLFAFSFIATYPSGRDMYFSNKIRLPE